MAPAQHRVAEPFRGGLEGFVHGLARSLRGRGHRVAVFAPAGVDPMLEVEPHPVHALEISDAAWADVHAPPRRWMQDHHAYLGLMTDLQSRYASFYDVVHDHSLHHLPVAMAAAVATPIVTTLHTPPLPWLESAAALAGDAVRFTAVSRHTADAWAHVTAAQVVTNGVDTGRWRAGSGRGDHAVWSGRLVPEKAPHLAIDACRAAGVPLLLAGPVADRAYVEAEVRPRLGPHARYLGHLEQARLAHVVGSARVCVVSPTWEEPFGLVAAEALACGTPVAAFDRGGLAEVLGPCGALAAPDDVDDLARAVRIAATRSRGAARDRAVGQLSVERTTTAYERLYRQLDVSAVA